MKKKKKKGELQNESAKLMRCHERTSRLETHNTLQQLSEMVPVDDTGVQQSLRNRSLANVQND